MNILIIDKKDDSLSQIARLWFEAICPSYNILSSGIEETDSVCPIVKEVMEESLGRKLELETNHISEYIEDEWDIVLAMSEEAKQDISQLALLGKSIISYQEETRPKTKQGYEEISKSINHFIYFLSDKVLNHKCEANPSDCLNCSNYKE